MSNYLITGFSGFVSRHFLEYLAREKRRDSILGIDLNPPGFKANDFPGIKWKYEEIDLMEKKKVENSLRRFRPDYILHLASYSSVAFSWKNPTLSFQNNTNIFLNLLEAVRKIDLPSRILAVGSSDEYGNVTQDCLPLNEDSPLNPVSPYAVARVAQELLA
ncbi:MAG: GDP-mannose 4,6-dehydratase, partial [Candidatus Omnitrophica bacterium]|nr:GDP-mannose 4,6-dehydratase [Candidatus Omnitrophota bacterium]